MLSPIGRRGSSEEYGSWKMICISRRARFSAPEFMWATSCPSKSTCPRVGSTSRSTVRPNFVLPQPDSPTKPSVSPRRMKKLTSSTARTHPWTRWSNPARTLGEALQSLRDDKVLCDGLGEAFVAYYCKIKEAELARFHLEVTDWEQREYF